MDESVLLFLFVLLLGMSVYFVKPKYLFMYWLSVPAFVIPTFFFLFHPQYKGDQTIETFYFGYRTPLLFLLMVIAILEYLRYKKQRLKISLIPFCILVTFLVVQNVIRGVSLGTLAINVREVVLLLIPTVVLSISPRIRPDRKGLILFLLLYLYVQFIFCALNIFGLRLYTIFSDSSSFADEYICGTFLRYNHLTNYLTTFYLALSTAYFVDSSIPKYFFISTSIIICFIIMASGARISVILFFLTIGLYLLFFRSKKIVLLSVFFLLLIYGFITLSSKYDVGAGNADQGTGLERNVAGLMDLFETKSMDDNTLSLSAFLFLDYFNNPLMGNGYAYRHTGEYELSDTLDEEIMRTDARMAYMIVEYGLFGCICFTLFFYGLIKCNMTQYGKNNKKMWIIIVLYYILFSFTETGMFDFMQLSMMSIYCASIESVKQIRREVIKSTVKIENATATN